MPWFTVEFIFYLKKNNVIAVLIQFEKYSCEIAQDVSDIRQGAGDNSQLLPNQVYLSICKTTFGISIFVVVPKDE